MKMVRMASTNQEKIAARESNESNTRREHKLCSVVLTKGKRKGLSCNRKILPETEAFCKFHLTKSIPQELCKVILTKGDRKNQTCNRKVASEGDDLCKIHRTQEDRKPRNPYVENEADVTFDDDNNSVISELGSLDVDRLHPLCWKHLQKKS